jgi:hypothetical protein
MSIWQLMASGKVSATFLDINFIQSRMFIAYIGICDENDPGCTAYWWFFDSEHKHTSRDVGWKSQAAQGACAIREGDWGKDLRL